MKQYEYSRERFITVDAIDLLTSVDYDNVHPGKSIHSWRRSSRSSTVRILQDSLVRTRRLDYCDYDRDAQSNTTVSVR